MPFADMNTIVMCSPVYVAPLAYFVLKEKVSKFQLAAIFFAIIGVILITRPTPIFGPPPGGSIYSAKETIIGTSLALVSAIGVAFSMIFLRKVPETSSTVTIIWFSIISLVLGVSVDLLLKFAIHSKVTLPVTTSDWIWCNVSAIFGTLNQVLFVWALKLEPAGIVALIRTFDIVMAFGLQVAFLNQPVLWTSAVGATIVFLTVIITYVNKIMVSKNKSLFDLLSLKTQSDDTYRIIDN